MSSVSAVIILNSTGQHVISRDYRGEVPLACRSAFVRRVIRGEDEPECGYIAPIFVIDGVVYSYIQQEGLYYIAVSRSDVNCALVSAFLHKLVTILASYFPKVNEETIRDNFTLVYEILDEAMDFGLPQTTEPDVLKEFIMQHDLKRALLDRLRPKATPAVAPIAATGAVSWRKENIKYRKNEVFLDVMEEVSMVVNPEGRTLSAEVRGRLMMETRLSGTPEVKIGFNDRVSFDRALGTGKTDEAAQLGGRGLIELEDVKMHQCVRLANFDEDRTISFIPPDNKFELMSYRISSAVIRPLIQCAVQETNQGSSSHLSFLVRIRTNFKASCNAKDIVVSVPVPADASAPQFHTRLGSGSYNPSSACFEWHIRQMPGKEEASMQAEFSLPSIREPEEITAYSRRPIELHFGVPYFSVSGIQVRYLRVSEKSGYEATPWIRYLSSGDITTRRR